MIPLFKVNLNKEGILNSLETVLSPNSNGDIFIGQGPKVEEFEDALWSYLKTKTRPVTVNSCTSALDLALHLSGVGPGDEVISTAMTCVGSTTPVLMADGTTMPISKIVNNKLPVQVMSLNEGTGKLESKTVTNWVKLPSKKDWYRLTISPNPTLGKQTKKVVWITGDHKVLTKQDGWKRVDNLESSDLIATQYEDYTGIKKSFIDGLILSDGCIQKNKHEGCRLTGAFVSDKAELAVIAGKLLNCSLNPRPAHGASKEAIAYQSKSSPFWRDESDRWYPSNRKKIVPKDLNLDEHSLAVWFMGDGSLTVDNNSRQVVFCTDGFDTNSFWRLFYNLVELGYKPTATGIQHKKRICLGETNGDVDKFFNAVAKHILPCFRYKVPTGFADYCGTWDVEFERIPLYSKFTLSKEPAPKHIKPDFVYCIEVADTHNFLSHGMVLHNCFASNSVIVNRGAKIVWADIDPITGLIDPKSAEKLCTVKTKAIMAVNWAGRFCDFAELKKNGVPVIEDAAHTWDVFLDDEVRASIERGDYICYSFQAIKFLTTLGDGGCLICEDPAKEDLARLLRWYGLDRTKGQSFRCAQSLDVSGYKYHMNDVAATGGLENLKSSYAAVSTHIENAMLYCSAIKNKVNLTIPYFNPFCSYWLFSILVEKGTKEEFMAYLAENGIASSPVHYRNDKYKCVEQFLPEHELPGLEAYSQKQVSIPVGFWLSEKDKDHIINTCNRYKK